MTSRSRRLSQTSLDCKFLNQDNDVVEYSGRSVTVTADYLCRPTESQLATTLMSITRLYSQSIQCRIKLLGALIKVHLDFFLKRPEKTRSYLLIPFHFFNQAYIEDVIVPFNALIAIFTVIVK